MKTITSAIKFNAALTPAFSGILTSEALEFTAALHRKFNHKRKELLKRRVSVQQQTDKGIMPGFHEETSAIRESEWIVSPLPEDLLDRRVEITGPVERKMIINALNSGARVFMADFEDSNSPTWENILQGQINLRDAVDKTIFFTNENGKKYILNEKTAVLMVRPRGWHMEEKHVLIDDEPLSASIFDFALFFFHNAGKLIAQGTAPYFYLPKIEHYLEARLWNEIFIEAQKMLGIPSGTIKATVLIETILAAFEMDEILFELREHSAGLNCGRWDYIFSFIKKFRNHKNFILPDRAQVTMNTHFMRSYSRLLIKTCHRRNVHAMGGMAAQIPIKNDAAANEAAIARVRADKEREAGDGHDGTWVAHPGLIPVAKEVFDRIMKTPNQVHNKRTDVTVSAEDLLAVPEGTITESGFLTNIDVGIQYTEAWLRGSGCVPIYHLMEDAATAEISRTQLWQWLHHGNAVLDDGRKITHELYRSLVPKAVEKIKLSAGEKRFQNGKYAEAIKLFDKLITSEKLEDFLTLSAYNLL